MTHLESAMLLCLRAILGSTQGIDPLHLELAKACIEEGEKEKEQCVTPDS